MAQNNTKELIAIGSVIGGKVTIILENKKIEFEKKTTQKK